MSDFVIITDSSSDLNKELREKYDIADYVRGILYFPDSDRSELVDLDWSLMTPDEYFNSMKEHKNLYKTAAPTIEEVTTVFEKYLKQGLDILSINISTGLSATVETCKLAAKDLLEKYPDRKIIVIDTLRYSTSQALVTIDAAMKRLSGATLEETAAYCEEEKTKVHQIGTMDDMFFLAKSGRISNFKAFFGNMIGLNALADINDKGLSEVLARFKGKRDAHKAVIEYIKRTIVNPEEQTIFIAQSLRKEASEQLANLVREEIKPKEIIMNDVGISCGANIGPGLTAVFYKGEKATPGLEKEKAIMEEISASIKK